jgi:hypothetical protein
MKALLSVGTVFAVLGASNAGWWQSGIPSLPEAPLLLVWGAFLLTIGRSVRQRPATASDATPEPSRIPAARPTAARLPAPRLHPSSVGLEVQL